MTGTGSQLSAVAGSQEGPLPGYLNPDFANSMSEFGSPLALPASGGWLLVRSIPGADAHDATAAYRHLFCTNWSGLAQDLANLDELVSLVAVPDPCAGLAEADLRAWFPDLVRPYKSNQLIDLADVRTTRHHRAKARQALARVEVDLVDDPRRLLDEWIELYANLGRRHSIGGVNAFSRGAFALQLGAPGCVAFRARIDGRAVAIMLWYLMGEVAHYHLGASSETGYEVSASYALVAAAVDGLGPLGARLLNLGASAGVEEDPSDGLARFKRGWASYAVTSKLCGRIFDRVRYERLAGDHPQPAATPKFFPAYRS